MKHRQLPDERCPLCNEKYSETRILTKHHIFPKFWYKAGVRVRVCEPCHKDFNAKNPMGKNPWPRESCLKRWIHFCKTKGKEAFEKYPQLIPYAKEFNLD